MDANAIYWPSFFFLLFSGIACAFALGVLLSKNIVRMAFYLVLSLASTAGLFFLAGADFVGAMQLMIYVGGTLVLLIFGVMLTSQERFVEMRTSSGEWMIAFVIGLMLFFTLGKAAFGVAAWHGLDRETAEAVELERTVSPLAMGLLGARVDKLPQGDGSARGSAGELTEADRTRQAGMAGYLFHFEIVSIHLLVVLVGAAYLARAKRKASGIPGGDQQ
jgi:NADH-quinone oxidoreductase subunit J